MQNRAFNLILGAEDIALTADETPSPVGSDAPWTPETGDASGVDAGLEEGLSGQAPDDADLEDDAGASALPDAAPVGRTTWDGVSLEQILRDRPDVLSAYVRDFYGPNNDPHSSAWMNRVGGTMPEDYADYWYRTYGSAPAVRTTSDGVPLSQILHDRPDVYRLFFTEYYGPNNDRHSHAWADRVGGTTPEDYARYWYESGGKYGYARSDGQSARSPVDPSVYAGGRTTSDGVYLEQILHDRPDVFALFFTEYYGPNNDRHSPAWMDRVGGATPQDYAKYWYEHGGKYEYTPEPLKVDTPDPLPAEPEAGVLDPADAPDGGVSSPDASSGTAVDPGAATPTEDAAGGDDAPVEPQDPPHVPSPAGALLPDETAWTAPDAPPGDDDLGAADSTADMDAGALLIGQSFCEPAFLL